jgi:hypothetical protein
MSNTVLRDLGATTSWPEIIGAQVKVTDNKVIVELLGNDLKPLVILDLSVEAAFDLADRLDAAGQQVAPRKITLEEALELTRPSESDRPHLHVVVPGDES